MFFIYRQMISFDSDSKFQPTSCELGLDSRSTSKVAGQMSSLCVPASIQSGAGAVDHAIAQF